MISKSIRLLFILMTVTYSLKAQEWVFSNSFNGSIVDPKYSVIDELGNNIILASFDTAITDPFNINAYGRSDIILVKLSNEGNVIWYKHIGGILNDIPGGLALDESDNIYVAGNFYGTCKFTANDSLISKGDADVYISKYSSDGIFQWAKTVASSENLQGCTDILFDGIDRILMSGFFNTSLIIGSSDADKDTLTGNAVTSNFTACFSLEAERIWANRYLGTYNLSRIRKIGLSESGYYFGGHYKQNLDLGIELLTSSTSANYDIFLFKTDLDGNILWVRQLRGSGTENFKSLSTDEFFNLYVLANYNSLTINIDSTENHSVSLSSNLGKYDALICKYNRSGILQWYVQKGSAQDDAYNNFVVKNNMIYATGYFTDEVIFNNDTIKTDNILNEDAFIATFNAIGDPISGASIQGTGNYIDAGSIINMDQNSRAIVSGYYRSPQIRIGNKIYTSNNINQSDLFFGIYQQQFKAVITDENMISCNGLTDGMLTVTPYFGRPPFTYSWSHNANLNSPVAEDLSPGEYTVTITDANDSVAIITAEITQPAGLNVQGLITPVNCYNGDDGAIDLTVTGGTPGTGYEYFWTTLNGSGIVPLNQDQTNLTGGTYTVQVVDANQCADTVDFTVDQPEPFNYAGTTVTTIIVPISPSGRYGQVNLSIAGGTSPYSFDWSGPNGYTATSEDIANLSDAGLYDLTITDDHNCTSDTTIAVIDNFTFIAQIAAKSDVLCFNDDNGSATVRVSNGTPPYSYKWSDGFTLDDSVRTGMQPDNYIVTVTDGAAKTSQASVLISGPASALTIVLDAENLSCNGDNSGVIDLIVSGGTLPYAFDWSSGYTGEDLVNIPADVYTIVVTDGNGCEDQDTKEITEPDAIGVIIVPSGEILCHGDRSVMATANATGGTPPGSYTYLWDDPGNQTTQTAYDLGAGKWHVIVTDSNGCSKTAEIVIMQPDSLTVSAVLNSPSCPGLDDGSIIPTPAGGSGAGYEYIWSNGVYQRFNTDIPAGTYILTLNDDNNCVLIDTFDLADPDSIEITSVVSTDVTCFNRTDGTISITAEGGSGVYNYSSDGGSTFNTSSVISDLAAGEYEVVVSDENDCQSESVNVNLTIADTVTIDSIITIDPSCIGLDNGALDIAASGGNGNLEFSADGGNNFTSEHIIGSLDAGEYQVVARDENDCVSETENIILVYKDTVTITDIQSTDLTCSGLPDGTITVTASGGEGNYEYSTDGGTTFVQGPVIGSMAQGDYLVIARDQNECRSEEVEVTLSRTDICGLIIYDGFSPNGDGKNELWNIGNAGSFPNIKVKIFNLWGKMVFSSNGYGTPWDGKFNGNELPSGTYYYVIDPGDGSDVITGDVSIVK